MGCEVINLTEATHTIVGDEMCTLNRELQIRSRFGRTTDMDLVQLKQISATKSDLENDPAFKKAWIVENRHFFNPDDPNHKTVESENIRRTFDFAEKNDQPVVHLKAIHTPVERTSILEQAPGREFEGLLKDFVACKDLPILLLTNIAPQFGLYNGATLYFHGLLYLPDDLDLTLTASGFKK